jgi:helix-turn-helix protein
VAHTASLALGRRAVTFERPDEPLRIDLSEVTHFGRTTRTVDGTSRPALEVQFTRDRRAMTTEVVVASGRRMNLLVAGGRHHSAADRASTSVR